MSANIYKIFGIQCPAVKNLNFFNCLLASPQYSINHSLVKLKILTFYFLIHEIKSKKLRTIYKQFAIFYNTVTATIPGL